MRIQRIFLVAVLMIVALAMFSCERKAARHPETPAGTKAKIIFLELGSVTCIPCKRMQPVMKSIEARYGGQVQVVFHDVMKDRSVSQKYGIRLIPTQVFLDANGKELMRHEGFFPEEEIDKFLRAQGLSPVR